MPKRPKSEFESLKAHKKFKVHSLTGRITPKIMLNAFKVVKQNCGAAGVDKVAIRQFEANLDQNLASLMKRLKTRGQFVAELLRRVYIPKGTGKTGKRPIGIPVVRDRIAQEVIRRLIDPIFDPLFHPASFGFRRSRNCHQAIETILQFLKEGYTYVVDADIKGFFDNIDHGLIMHLIRCEIADGNILDIIEEFLSAGVLEDGVPRPTVKGTPQGGVVSPLLANIVLNHLDWKLHEAGYKFVRYADDFVVLCRTRAQAEEALAFVHQIIIDDLKLQLSPEKTQICTSWGGFDFLGFTITSNGCRMSDKAIEKFKDKIRGTVIRSHNLDQDMITKLNRVIRGTMNYFAPPFATGRQQFDKLDRWIRKRIRCTKYKRISYCDNRRFKNKHIARMGLLSCYDLCKQATSR